MKPLRFLLSFIASYGIGFLVGSFLTFAAKILRDLDLIYGSFGIIVIVTFVFAWIYFKGVSHINWRQRTEAVLVWFALLLTLDLVMLFFFHGQTLSAIGGLHILVYALVLLALFTAAYVTAPSHPKLSSPDLIHPRE